ncbi:uncharacterized protein Triagg1_4698 [Trichoderma aggressivum f. europaeum]|uniref:Uncharacterized protein n=1 Tax=Trichoderma aggressivum f. europaeum TaxID=173218 RepID=A0AAE1IHA8_9HYPO|nr:hypothetical protein Triagg1_4698 [Trichoderma aggressivum f. europaeum]
MFAFSATSSSAAPERVPVAPKERPTLRICFPLKISRGGNSCWEYEEFQVQFQDRMMWRQAFGLDMQYHDKRFLHKAFGRRAASNRGEPSNAVDNDYGAASNSRWSSSTSETSSCTDKYLSGESTCSKTSQRLKQLMTRMLSATSSRSGKSGTCTREESQSFTSSSPSSNRCTDQHEALRPEPLNLPLRQKQPLDSEATGDETQRHRDDALRSLEGKSQARNNMSFSTFRSMFHARKLQDEDGLSPVSRTVPSIQPKTTPQDQRVIGLSSDEWDSIKHDIGQGIEGGITGIFPPYTKGQRAMAMPVQRVEESKLFRVQTPPPGEDMQRDGRKAALESIEASGWKDIIFVSYKDTPEVMRWWNTTQKPRVLQWGGGMV